MSVSAVQLPISAPRYSSCSALFLTRQPPVHGVLCFPILGFRQLSLTFVSLDSALRNSIYHRLQDLPWYSHAPSPRATASFTGNDSVQLLDVRLCCILVLVACLMRFLFVSSGICLHLPSDSTSRWTPLVFGYILPAVGWIRDFHPLERALAGRTTRKPRPAQQAAAFCFRPLSAEARQSHCLHFSASGMLMSTGT